MAGTTNLVPPKPRNAFISPFLGTVLAIMADLAGSEITHEKPTRKTKANISSSPTSQRITPRPKANASDPW